MGNSEEYIHLHHQEMIALPNPVKDDCATVGALRNDTSPTAQIVPGKNII